MHHGVCTKMRYTPLSASAGDLSLTSVSDFPGQQLDRRFKPSQGFGEFPCL